MRIEHHGFSLVLFVAGLSACGGAPVPVHTVQDNVESGDDAEAVPPANHEDGQPACPVSYAEARGSCSDGPSDGCTYPEGSCYCGAPRICSGAVREPVPPEMYAWQCTPVPPAVRADGCPGQAPSGDVPCSLDHECSYGSCGGSVYECVEGTWQMTRIIAPPP